LPGGACSGTSRAFRFQSSARAERTLPRDCLNCL